MSFNEHRIKVLSFQPAFVAISGRSRNVGMQGSDGITPSVEYFSWEDIEYINSTTNAIKTGMIEIDEEAREEVYKRLNIQPENCLYERDIDNLLLNPTMDGMKRIVAVTDVQTIERIRLHMAKHYGVLPQNVIKVVEARASELANGSRRSAIEIEPVVKSNAAESAKVAELNKQVEEQNKQIADLTKLVQQLLGKNEVNNDDTPVETVKPDEDFNAEETKRRGRPKQK